MGLVNLMTIKAADTKETAYRLRSHILRSHILVLVQDNYYFYISKILLKKNIKTPIFQKAGIDLQLTDGFVQLLFISSHEKMNGYTAIGKVGN